MSTIMLSEEIGNILEPCSEYVANFRDIAPCPDTTLLEQVFPTRRLDSLLNRPTTKFPCFFAGCNQEAYVGILGLCKLLRHLQSEHGSELSPMGRGKILLSTFQRLWHCYYYYEKQASSKREAEECLDKMRQFNLRASGTKVDWSKLQSSYQLELDSLNATLGDSSGQSVQDLTYYLHFHTLLKEVELYFQIKAIILKLLTILKHSAMPYPELLKGFSDHILQLNDRIDRLSRILSNARRQFTSSSSDDPGFENQQLRDTSQRCHRYAEGDAKFVSIVQALWADCAKKVDGSAHFIAQDNNSEWKMIHRLMIQALGLSKLLIDIWEIGIWNLFEPVYTSGTQLRERLFSESMKLTKEVRLQNAWQMEFRTSNYNVFKSPISGPKAQREIQSVESRFRSPTQHLYTPLDPAADEIRLIFVSVGTSGQLFAKMKHVSSGTGLPYIALSYVWGGNHKPNLLLVNGVYVNITESLDAALRSQVVLGYSSKGVPVWVDAICIDQENIQERNTEVLRMRKIYAQSLETICWLGKSAGSSDQAFDFLATLATNSDSKPTEQQRIGLCQLFSRDWWLRVWTIQEAVVPAALRVACGNCHIKVSDHLLSSLYKAIMGLKNETAFSPSFHLSDQSLRRLESLNSLRRTWFNNCSRGIPLDLLTLLVASRHALATDPRDKVFGLLALTPESQSLISRPNYRLAKREVYSQLVVAWITHYNSMDIVCHAGTADATRDLPSWVPDWSDGKSSVSFCSASWYAENKPVTRQVLIHASIPPSFSHDLSRMTIWAYELDKIQCVAEYGGSNGSKACITHRDANARVTRYDGTVMTFSALLRTVCGGQLSESLWASLDTIEFCRALHGILQDQGLDQTAASISEADKYIKAWFHNNSRFKVGNVTIGELVSQLPSTRSESEEAPRNMYKAMQAFREKFVKVTRGRLLFTTATGYLGISRQSVMPGDFAFLVPGCSAPLIVRQTGQMFKLVGDSYIHSNKGEPSMYGHWDAPKSIGKFTELKRIVLN